MDKHRVASHVRRPGQSAAEKKAQRWHDEHHRTGCGDCSCCCSACRLVNPHITDANAAIVNDIMKRVHASVADNRTSPDNMGR